MSEQVIIALIASVVGGLLVAITNQLFTREKTRAEAKKTEAEADKIKAETAKLLKEINLKETITVTNSQLPNGWHAAGDAPYDYEFGVDQEVVYRGKASGYIKSLRPSRGFGTLMQAFKASMYRGKRLFMSGYVKSENVEFWAGMWMRVDGPEDKMLGFDNMQDRPIKGTTGWTRYAVVLDVPDDSIDIAFGVLLDGLGQVWVDNILFETVGKDVPTTDLREDTTFLDQPVNLDFES
jgi:hypothetical protein